MNRQDEEQFDYDSSSVPATPINSENEDKKKKKSRGLKKLSSSKKSSSNLDKSPSFPEKGLAKEEGGVSDSRRRHLPSFLKFGGRTSDDVEPKSSESQSYNEKASQTLEEKNEIHSKVEASTEEPKSSKVVTPAEKIGEKTTLLERVKEDIHKHLHKSPKQPKIDDKGKPKEHQEPEGIANLGKVNEVVKHDPHHHHEQKEYSNDDVKGEKLAASESETVMKEHQDSDSPPPAPLHEKESVGCESLAQGLQNACLPWTVKKEDH